GRRAVRRLDHVRRHQQQGSGRRSPARRDHPERQRCLHCARRRHGRQREEIRQRVHDQSGARARPHHHRPCPSRRLVLALAGALQSASGSRHAEPGRTDRRHQAGLLRHRSDRLRRQRRHRRLQPRRLGLLDREWRDHLSRQRGHHRGPSVRNLQVDAACERSQFPLRHQCADAAVSSTSPAGRGRIASQDAIRGRACAVSWGLRPLTR
ncbi:hypothetical protein KXV85_002183, partial [Aspergillus fumigatus]